MNTMNKSMDLLSHAQDLLRMMREYMPPRWYPSEEEVLSEFIIEGMAVLDNYIADPDSEPEHIREWYDRLDRYRTGP